MKLEQTQKLTQILSLTPQMRQSLQVLQLPLMELKNYLLTQMQENPVLEIEEHLEQDYPLPENIEKFMGRDKDFSDHFLGYSPQEIKERRDYEESLITRQPTIEENLIKQLRIMPLDEKKYKIGEFIIANLDDNGYLKLSLEEMMSSVNRAMPGNKKVTKKEMEDILRLIHNFDPPGIGARNLKECLLIQLTLRNRENSIAYEIVNSYLPEVAKNKTKLIAKKLKVDLSQVNKAITEIASLEPKPGRAFVSSITQKITSSVPDVIAENVDGKYEIIVNTTWVPKLKINPYYLNLLKSNSISPQAKKYIQEKVKSALDLMKAILQREETLKKIVQYIVKVQKDFFEHGDSSLLKPLAYKDIAAIANRNESTISRTVKNKYISTPYGIFKLDYFFINSLKNKDGEKISQEFVKTQVLNIVNEEDNKKPLKDSEIVRILKSQGVEIARRTAAKYREELKIPPCHRRKT